MALVKKDIGELLVENGLLTPEEWEQVQVERQKTGEPVSLVLSRLGLATEAHVKNALELQYGVNYVALTKLETKPAEECMGLLPESTIRQHQVMPINKDGNRVTVAMVNPNNLMALDDIKVRLKGTQIKTVVCTEDDFQQFMETIYSKHIDAKTAEADSAEDSSFFGDDVDLSSMDQVKEVSDDMSDFDLENQSKDAPIINLANQLLAKAIKSKVSDIHIEPKEKEIQVRYRIDGVLTFERKLPKAILPGLVSRYKIMANLNISERRLPQDGRIRVRLGGKDVDFRVSVLPLKFGEKVVMRLLDKSNTMLGLDKIISDEDSLFVVKEMVTKPYGIIYVCGPTGSGKTTTLYAALAERNEPEVNIVTCEDPIEYDMNGITQVQVIREKGMDFARVLRAFLRQDPDIMLVGETRDKETAKIAIEAALTGHLVFTTLHANDAPGAIARLNEMDVDPFLISAATIGIVAQRLVRKVCQDCKEDYLPDKATLEYLGLMEQGQKEMADSTIQFYKLRVNSEKQVIFSKGKGCDNCRGSGYRGRLGCYEVMKLNDELREVIGKNSPAAKIRMTAKQNGMISIKDYSLRLVALGLTTTDEVVRVTMSDTGGDEKLCPTCRNPVSDDFVKCPFCQFELKHSCPRCGAFMESGWMSCAKCGLSLEEAVLDTVCQTCEAEVEGTWDCCPYCQSARPNNGKAGAAQAPQQVLQTSS
jgi:type IV pilus assembly protein PilB